MADESQGTQWAQTVLNWTEICLNFMIPALIVCCVVWIILVVLGRIRNRAFNLTNSETVGDGISNKPGFLEVDQKKRDAALRGGEAFDTHVANRETASNVIEPSKGRSIAGKCTVLLAILSLITGAIGALMRVEAYDNAIKKFGVWDNVVATVSNHTVGFVVAMTVIAVAAFNVFRVIQRGSA